MPSPYDVEAFETRVSYAAACIVKGCTNGRTFDTCFEMYDGDYVAEALMRRAAKNPRLAEALERTMRLSQNKTWQDSHEQFKHLTRKQLREQAIAYVKERCKGSGYGGY